MTAPVPVGAEAPPRDWFGHPAPLSRLFAIEMWERLGFYGMRALLVLYLTKHVLLGDRAAAGLYGGYLALVYLTPLAGGLLADRVLGSKRAVRFGALLMAAGYFALAAGGPPAQAWLAFDGERHAVSVAGGHDGPTTPAGERRTLVLAGERLAVEAAPGGAIALVDAGGAVRRRLPPGTFDQGARRDGAGLALLLTALALVAVGNGFFKPNISTMVGGLYRPGDRRRDAGFTIFYMGINAGSIIGQFLAPWLADTWGWGWGFGVSGCGMLVAFVLATFGAGRLPGRGDPPAEATMRGVAMVMLAALASVPALAGLFAQIMAMPEPRPRQGAIAWLAALPLMGKLLFASFVVGVPGLLVWTRAAGSRKEWDMMLAACLLISFNTVFWALFEQAGSSLTLFADRNTDRSVFGWFEMSAPQTQNFNSVSIVLLAPLVSALWAWLARRGREPSVPVKFALALVGAGAGFLLLVLGGRFAGPDARVGLGWLAGLYLVQSLAELLISPVGLSVMTRLAMARIVGLVMGVWFLSLAMGGYVAGLLAQVASVDAGAGAVADPRLSLATYLGVFEMLGWSAIAVGVVLLLLAPWLRRLMHEAA